MNYQKLASYMKNTDDPSEMIRIARKIVEDYPTIYTPLMLEKMREDVNNYIPAATPHEKENMLYRSVYDFWAFGCTVDEEFFLRFYEKTDAEKQEYLVTRLRDIYVHHLNSGGGEERINLLGDKYRFYKKLEPFFLRDVIEVSSEQDFPAFESFVKKHSEFVIKPSDFYCGIGVRKATLQDYNNDPHYAFETILNEGKAIKDRHPSRNGKMVLEEIIQQDPTLKALHPNSVNAVRASAVRGKDGKIHLFHPWIKVGVNGTFVASAALDGFDAEIDPETGVVITDGYQENGSVYQVHPNTGIRIKGLQIPKWNELIELVDELMKKLPEYGYIGWDLVLTPKGWCVMEGNYSGEFTYQMINNRGYKKEFEELIGWKYEKQYWWQEHGIKF